MESQQELDYKRVAEAISFFQENFKYQPKLEDVAGHVSLSPFHFQRMFHQCVGITPKQFLQYLSVEYAKQLLATTGASLFDVAYETGLSGTCRLHDLFMKIEGMTPGEWKNGGASLMISYSFADTPFGKLIVAATDIGICHMGFVDEGGEKELTALKRIFPNAKYSQMISPIQEHALCIFSKDWNNLEEIKIQLKANDFQIKIWRTLLDVPLRDLTTNSIPGKKTGYPINPGAVGAVVGYNPVALLIPCHRVIKLIGENGQYNWGLVRKNK